MIEKSIVKYLKEQLNIKVSTETPSNPPNEYLVVMTTNERKIAPNIETCLCSVLAYSKTMQSASELNERVKDAMEQICSLNEITACNLNAGGNDTDTERKIYRYRTTYDMTYYRRTN